MPRMAFYAPYSEESLAGAWKKSCSELQKSWQTQIRRGKVSTKILKLCLWIIWNISWKIKGTKRCETRIKTVTQRYLNISVPVEILLLCGGGAQFLGVCSVRACSSYRGPPLETLHSGLSEWPRQTYIFVQMIATCLVFLSSKNFPSLIYKLDSFG